MATSESIANDAVKRMQEQKLSPTLIIGLGGSGADVLLRIRKKFFEKFGGVDEFPIVSYLWFDTDKGYKEVGGKQFASKINFSNTEERLLTIGDTVSITGNLDKEIYRNIAAWWPTGLNIIPRLDEGAGQYRPYSRLGFYYHYMRAQSSIRQAIDDALGKIQNPASINKVMNSPRLQRLNYAADLDTSKRNVYLVGSLAGGTGSGLFLDMGRLVRDLAPDAILVGFFVTSRFFPQPKNRMHANTYAALLELDHYNAYPFRASWANDKNVSLPPPVFNNCYVLDSPNLAHLKLGVAADDQKKIYETIAENVFKDFSQGQFAQAKRSARSNVNQFMGNPWWYPPLAGGYESSSADDRTFRQRFNRHYQSFGLASISIPHDRIITACAHKLAARLILYWKGEGASDNNVATIGQDVNNFLASQQALLDVESILTRLDDAGANAEKASASGSLLNEITRFVDKTFDTALAKPSAERAEFIDAEISRFRSEQLNPAARGQNTGQMIRRIEQNATRIVEKGAKDIENCCDRRIDEDKFSVLSTTTFANRIAEVLEEQRGKIAENLEWLNDRIQILESDYNHCMAELRSHSVRHNLDFRKSIILSYDMLRLSEVVSGAGKTSFEKDDHPGLLLSLRRKAILEKAVEICTGLITKIQGSKTDKGDYQGGIVMRLQELDRAFDQVARTLREDAGYFEMKLNDDLSLVLFERTEVDSKYFPKYVNEETVKQISDQARNRLQITAASVKDSNFLKQEGGSGQIIDLCREVFEPIRHDYHIVDLFFEHFGGGEGRDGQPIITERMSAELNRVFSSARAWADGGADATRNYTLEHGQDELFVGLPAIPTGLGAINAERIRRRRDAISQFLQTRIDQRFTFTDIPETSEIIFYNELSGVPLNFFSSMYELRQWYWDEREKTSALHLESKDASKFEDFLIPTKEETQRLFEGVRCLARCSQFDEIWVKPGEGRKMEYGYTETVRGVDSNPRMGDERDAVRFLQRRNDIREKLERRAQDRYNAIVAQARGGSEAQQAREALVALAAITICRMEQLTKSAEMGDWGKLPILPKMEYLALSEFNDRIHVDAQWPEFASELSVAKVNLGQIAASRPDGRYTLKVPVMARTA